MSKYSNISATSLKSTIQSALNELSGHTFTTIQSNLTSTSVLQSSVTSVLDSALNKINTGNNTGSVSVLKKNLTTLSSACSKIENIQGLEKEIERLKPQIIKTRTVTKIDSNGDSYETTETYTDQNVVNAIQSKNNQISNLEKEIDNLLK